MHIHRFVAALLHLVVPCHRLITATVFSLAFLLSSFSTQAAIELPIEVVAGYNPTAVAETVSFSSTTSGAATLQFWIHNLQYDGMASVKINNVAWMDLSNSNTAMSVVGLGGSYGGVGGGFHTILISIPLPIPGQPGTAVNAGNNTIDFRMNAPFDKEASGFRVTSIAVQMGGSNILTTPTNQITSVAPGTGSDASTAWIGANTAANAAKIAAGKALWQGTGVGADDINLRSMPGGVPINATCASCHTQNGSDLRYFGFTNKSIYSRARFHGLTDPQAQNLTRYIRSLTGAKNVPTTAAWGRPWNPPYQPLGDDPATMGINEAIGARAVTDWAAGGGLSAVLTSDAQMKSHLLPGDTTVQTNVDNQVRTINGASTGTSLKTYNIPVALQFPDWNRWLPRKAPEDIWPTFNSNNNNGIVETPYEAYEDIRAKLTTNGLAYYTGTVAAPATGARKAELVKLLSSLHVQLRVWVAAGAEHWYPFQGVSFALKGNAWRAVDSDKLTAAGGSPAFVDIETAKRSLAAWGAVKYFEIMREFGIEGTSPMLFPNADALNAVGEPRGWPTSEWAVFAQAPHITAGNLDHWADHETLLPGNITPAVTRANLQGDYLSSIWYHLQMVLNSGQRQHTDDVSPIDWEYQTIHIQELALESGVQDPLRMVETVMKIYQVRDNSSPLMKNGWSLRVVVPSNLFSERFGDTTQMATLDGYETGLWQRVLNAFINEYVNLVRRTSFIGSNLTDPMAPKYWPRYDPDNVLTVENRYDLEPTTYQPTEWESSFKYRATENANRFWRLLPDLESLGCSSVRIAALRTWCAEAWPGPPGNPNQWGTHPTWNLGYYNVSNTNVANKYLYADATGATLNSNATHSYSKWKFVPTATAGTSIWWLMERGGAANFRLHSTDVDLNPSAEIRLKTTAEAVVAPAVSTIRDYWRLIHVGAGSYRIVNRFHNINPVSGTYNPWLRTDGVSVYTFNTSAVGPQSSWKFTPTP